MGTPTVKYPYMDVTVSGDRLKGFINIIASGSGDADLNIDYLKENLKRQGIVFGVHDEQLEKIVRQWNGSKKNIVNELVAEGIPPETAGGGGMELLVKGVTDKDILTQIFQLKVKHISAIMPLCKVDKVESNSVLLQRTTENDLIPGTSIFGEELQGRVADGESINTGDGVAFDLNKKQYLAKQTGIACYIGNKLDVIPVIFDGYVDLKLDPTNMVASAVLYPEAKDSSPLTAGMVMEALKSNMVKTGILTDQISSFITEAKQTGKPTEAVVARGKAPKPGEDAQIEYLIDFNPSLKPEQKEDGSVDFKNVSLIKSVEPFEPLAKYIPPTRGTPGVNLLGMALPAPDGKDRKLPFGKNTEASKDDPDILVASVSGNARINQNLIEVTECYIVNNDVDFSTGNIRYPKTVLVQGDIKSGFQVEVGGDLEVMGIVEDSKIAVGGNVLIKAGFLGNGEGSIEAKGEVGLGFARNQLVRCRKSINIIGEAINCKLYARHSIEVLGKKLGIVGGIATARREIICESAGNESGTKTQLEVGLDYALVEEKFNTEEKIRELGSSKLKIDTHLAKLVRIQAVKKSLPQKEMLLLKKLSEMQSKVKNQLQALEERKNLILEKLSQIEKSRILIKRKIYAGVTIKIGDNFFTVDKDMEGPKSFIMRNDSVRAV